MAEPSSVASPWSSAAQGTADEPNEETPLQPAKIRLYHRESIFSMVVFLPPLTRQSQGHYCTWPVVVTAVLFFVTVTCQLSLTLIAGGHINEQSSQFKVSLVRHEEWRANAITPVDWLQETVKHKIETNFEPAAVASGPCCDSADCVTLYPCCGKQMHTDSNVRSRRHFLKRGQRGNNTDLRDMMHSYVFGSSGNVALCRADKTGLMDCTPPSYSYLDAWEELDHNGDGDWTFDEAVADKSNLGCRLGLSPRDFFTSAIRGIVKDAKDTADNSYAIPLIPKSIEERKSIPKAYFEHFKGLVVICMAADMGRCGNLIKAGLFDGAIGLKSSATRGGIHDLDSSLDFCQRMLRPNGVCEQVLPHTFQLYRSRLAEKCGSPSFTVGAKYINPHNPRDAMSIVDVAYSELSKFVDASRWDFQTFLFLILVVWYLTLVLELSRIIELIDFLRAQETAEHDSYSIMHPSMSFQSLLSLQEIQHNMSSSALGKESKIKKSATGAHGVRFMGMEIDGEHNTVRNLSRPHFAVCSIMVTVRIFLWFYMADVGTTFLLATFSYDDLLFNAVALAFIFELPEFLYVFLIPDDVKDMLGEARTLKYQSSLPQSGWKILLISRAAWGIFVIPICVFAICAFNYSNNIAQSSEALNCACLQSGPQCAAAVRFNAAWWSQYWKDTFPLAKLRSSYLS